ncbi:putative ribonuclease H-like domain-containing protein [Tanacetum coccineum]|uniref:Ribonuclease H-like domain-containing protein n=1 Tax=Tanacetum coccineum TaxID=301880 RepID=A0ABQ4WV98_9ASTR
MTGQRSQLINFVNKFLGTVRFGNNQVAAIMGYGDYQIGNVTISRVYYVEGLGHNLFLVDQFCDSDLEVAFRKHSCFVRDLDDVDLLKGLRDTNLYTISLEDMLKSSLICLLSKASKTKSWLWHRRLSHLNFGTINQLVKDGLSRDNGTEFVNKNLRSCYEDAPLFLWAEAVATTYYTQKRSLVRTRHNKTPYELLHDRKPDLKYLHVFGALCYPTNDSEDLGKLKPKADIGIFIGYSPANKAYQIYNKRTRMIMETIHVEFDELTTMASEQFGSGPAPQLLTLGYISSGLPPPSVVSRVPPVPAPIPADTTGTPLSTTIDQDAPSASTSPTTEETQALVIHRGVEEQIQGIQNAQFDNDSFINIFTTDPSSDESSSTDVIPSNLHQINPPFDHLRKCTKDHPFNNVIGNLSRPVSTRRQLQTDAMLCYFDANLTKFEPKNYKKAMKESCWIDAMQEEIYEFDRLQVWELVPRPNYIMMINLKWLFKVTQDEFGGVLKNKA